MTRTQALPFLDDDRQTLYLNDVNYNDLVKISTTNDPVQGTSETRYTKLGSDARNPVTFVIRATRVPKSKTGAVKGLAAINGFHRIVDDVANTEEFFPFSVNIGYSSASGEITPDLVMKALTSVLHLLIDDTTASEPSSNVIARMMFGVSTLEG